MAAGKNISVYLDAETLELLDEQVARKAHDDIEQGKTGRAVTSRSSLISYAILHLDELPSSQPELTIPLIQAVVSPIARRFGAERVCLFGSHARGEQRSDSDVDLYLEKGAITGLEVFDFQQCLEKALGRSVDIVTSKGAGPRIMKRIEDEAVEIYVA